MQSMDLAALRQEYMRAGLQEKDLAPDPLAQFGAWFDEALRSGIALPNAMTLATATRGGRPSARTVLLKGFDASGFVFYTNYQSRKGRELEANPQAMLLFCWEELERQIGIEGRIGRVSGAESDEYFASRPLGSRLSASVSPQSEIVENRDDLERRLEEASRRWRDAPPRPQHWGGYRLAPERFEFWQGRKDRLHDRLCYLMSGSRWKIERLAP
jgi:pyridoxamine 5'-phosphate oxidase